MNYLKKVDETRMKIISQKTQYEKIKKYIIGLDNLRDACILAKEYLTPATYGCIINSWFRAHYDFTAVNASLRIGDDLVFNEYKTEVKTSISTSEKFNYVQFRLTHDIDFYLLPTYDLINDKIYLFLINKKDMIELIKKYGSYAHGSKSEKGLIENNINNQDIEFALRPKLNSEVWQTLLNYEITEEKLTEKNFWKREKKT